MKVRREAMRDWIDAGRPPRDVEARVTDARRKARILLVSTNREGGLWTAFPGGLCAVAGAAAAAGHQVATLDLRFVRNIVVALRRALRVSRPDVVGLSVRNIDSVSAQKAVFFLETIRDRLVPLCREASIPSVIGGPAVGVGGQALVDFLGADWGIAGEGEEAFPRLVEALARGGPPNGVPGLLRRNSPPPPDWRPAHVSSLSDFHPLEPARWVPADRYWRIGTTYPLLTRRGCPFGCVYCSYPAIEGAGCRLRPPGAVAEEVRSAVASGVRHFEIVDSIFGLPEDHALGICNAVRDTGLRVTLDISGLHPLGVSPRLLDALGAAGGRGVLCTPDSFSAAGLDGLRKGFGLEVVAAAARHLRSRPLEVCWFLVLGGPGETATSAAESLRFVEREIPPHHLVLVNVGLRVYPGTPLAALCRERGLVGAEDPLIRPFCHIEPTLDLQRLRSDIEETVARCPNVIFMGEEPQGAFRQALLGRVLRWMAGPRPAWTALPRLLRFSSRFLRRDPLTSR